MCKSFFTIVKKLVGEIISKGIELIQDAARPFLLLGCAFLGNLLIECKEPCGCSHSQAS